MTGYSTADVAALLGLTPARIRAYAREKLVEPVRGPGGAYRFSFQDIVLLRTAKELTESRVGARRIMRALRGLRAQLPKDKPLTAVRISADGDDVIARDGDTAWHPASGQVALDFAVAEVAEAVAPLVRRAAATARDTSDFSAEDWYNLALDLETVGVSDEAQQAYRNAIDKDPTNSHAYVNLGRLLHESGRQADAEALYRAALGIDPDDTTAAFNLGIVLEDMGRRSEAIVAYECAIAADAAFADAHYNLSHLYEESGNQVAALRHLTRYRTLTRQPRR